MMQYFFIIISSFNPRTCLPCRIVFQSVSGCRGAYRRFGGSHFDLYPPPAWFILEIRILIDKRFSRIYFSLRFNENDVKYTKFNPTRSVLWKK